MAGNFVERIRRSPTTKLAVWGAIIVWEFFFLLFSLIMAAWAGAVMHNSFSGWLQVFLEYAIPVFIIITTMAIIFYVSRYSRRKLGVARRQKAETEEDVEI